MNTSASPTDVPEASPGDREPTEAEEPTGDPSPAEISTAEISTAEISTAEPPAAGPPLPADAPDDAAPPASSGRKGLAALVAVALIAGATGSVLTRALGGDSGSEVARPTGASRPSLRLSGETLDVAGVVAKAEPSVVSIRAAGRFGGGAGTGVILTATGEILTNAHVVDGAPTVRVTLAGESEARTATVVGTDDAADLALLRIAGATDLRPATLGRSADVAVGDDVVAIGNALALRGGPTVTRGIVSALDRSVETASGTITGLIQTDASISSGNSGGPLVNAAGEVIGINTAVAASRGGTAAENIGFAIAIDQAMPVVERLRDGRAPARRGLLGVRTSDTDEGSRGAVVVSVTPGSPAEEAGIRAGDLITEVDGRAVDGAAALASAVRAHEPGESIELTLVRDGRSRTVRATLASSTDG